MNIMTFYQECKVRVLRNNVILARPLKERHYMEEDGDRLVNQNRRETSAESL